MTKEMFNQIVLFLEGAYSRKFPDAALTVAWSVLEKFDDHIVGLGARRMVEEGEEYPSPTKWLRCVKAIEREAREDQRAAESKARFDVYHQLPAQSSAEPPIPVAVGGDHPRYPGMGLRQILEVRALEKNGVSHEAALAEVGGKFPGKGDGV